MTQKKGLLIEIGVTIVVFMIATIALGVVYERNVKTGIELPWININIQVTTNNPELQNTVLAFLSKEELQNIFPKTINNINWETHILLTYIGNAAPTSDYSYEITEGIKIGSVATLKYNFSFSETNDTFPLGIDDANQNYPVLFVALKKSDIDITNQFTFRFQNAITNETHSLTLFEHESPTTNN